YGTAGEGGDTGEEIQVRLLSTRHRTACGEGDSGTAGCQGRSTTRGARERVECRGGTTDHGDLRAAARGRSCPTIPERTQGGTRFPTQERWHQKTGWRLPQAEPVYQEPRTGPQPPQRRTSAPQGAIL